VTHTPWLGLCQGSKAPHPKHPAFSVAVQKQTDIQAKALEELELRSSTSESVLNRKPRQPVSKNNSVGKTQSAPLVSNTIRES